MKTIDDYIAERNEIQLRAENKSYDEGTRCWTELGVANRHIERVLNGVLPLRIVENEIAQCLDRARGIYLAQESGK